MANKAALGIDRKEGREGEREREREGASERAQMENHAWAQVKSE